MRRRLLLAAPMLWLPPRVARVEELDEEPNYRLWANEAGEFPKSRIRAIRLPRSAGTARDYGEDVLVSSYIRPLFHFTGEVGIGPWYGFFTGEGIKAYAVAKDLRTVPPKTVRFYKYDRLEVRFWNGSSVLVQFIGISPGSAGTFKVEIGTERDAQGNFLNPAAADEILRLSADDRHCASPTKKCSGGGAGSYAPLYAAGARVFSISWSWGAGADTWRS